MRAFEYRTFVGFEETNVVGNVYFANYFVWQGKCREAFLREYAPRVLEDFKAGFGMITKESSCVFHQEAFAFQKILVRMRLEKLTRTMVAMLFDYLREEDDGRATLLAQGRQVAMWVSPEHQIAMLPRYLYKAIDGFAKDDAPAAPQTEAA
jgi:enediyne biosynthesis thioesterase